MSTSLLINIFINDELKFNHFKITFSDISSLFDYIHLKVRGRYKDKCLKYALLKTKNQIISYQDLDDKDWVSTTSEMVKNINTKSIFLYNEDHILSRDKDVLKNIIDNFNIHRIDYLRYSFFRASRLNSENILPLNPKKNKYISYFKFNNKKLNLIGKISPNYYHISIISLFSKKYLEYILLTENSKFKIYIKIINSIVARFIPSKRRYFYNYINRILTKINIKLCLYPPNTPFNLEKMWFENYQIKDNWNYAILNSELFTNYDDDNGLYGESLIKKGLYPFEDKFFLRKLKNRKDLLTYFTLTLKKGEEYDCTYFSRRDRINTCPVLSIEILSGNIKILSKKKYMSYKNKNKTFIFANLGNKLIAKSNSKIKISVFDEVINL